MLTKLRLRPWLFPFLVRSSESAELGHHLENDRILIGWTEFLHLHRCVASQSLGRTFGHFRKNPQQDALPAPHLSDLEERCVVLKLKDQGVALAGNGIHEQLEALKYRGFVA